VPDDEDDTTRDDDTATAPRDGGDAAGTGPADAGGDGGGGGPPDAGDDAGGTAGGRDRPGGDGGEYAPPSREEWRNVLSALSAANNEAKRHRLDARALRQAAEAAQRETETEHEKALRRAAEEAEAKAEAHWKPRIALAAAKGALRDAGAVLADPAGKPLPGREARMLRMLDLRELDVADDGTVSGLAEQVAAMKAETPELFERREPAARPKVDAADRKPEPKKPKTSAEQLAQVLAGG
jgi:hypothetical protein